MIVRVLEDILCIAVLILTPDVLCESLGVYRRYRRIMERRHEIE